MTPTQWSRKIDKMGRIVLPVKLRDKYGLEEGLECPIFTHEENGRVYICFQAPPAAVARLKEAMELLERYGMKAVQNDD